MTAAAAVVKVERSALAWAAAPPLGDWAASASCASLPAEIVDELFFPDSGYVTADARRICDACPVRLDCHLDALAVAATPGVELHGIRAGLNRADRDRILGRNAA